MNIDATVYFLGQGLSVIKKGAAEEIQLGSFPALSEMMQKAVDAGVKFIACVNLFELVRIGIEKTIRLHRGKTTQHLFVEETVR